MCTKSHFKRHFQPMLWVLTDMEWSFDTWHRSCFKFPCFRCKAQAGSDKRSEEWANWPCHTSASPSRHALLHPFFACSSWNQTALQTILISVVWQGALFVAKETAPLFVLVIWGCVLSFILSSSFSKEFFWGVACMFQLVFVQQWLVAEQNEVSSVERWCFPCFYYSLVGLEVHPSWSLDRQGGDHNTFLIHSLILSWPWKGVHRNSFPNYYSSS